MANELLLAAANELERSAAMPIEDAAGVVISMELAGLAARLRQAVRWLDRPPAAACRCHELAPGPATAEPAAKPMSLTKAQAAELLGLSVRTLDRIADAGELHPMKRGRVVRYDRGELERYLQNGREAAGATNGH